MLQQQPSLCSALIPIGVSLLCLLLLSFIILACNGHPYPPFMSTMSVWNSHHPSLPQRPSLLRRPPPAQWSIPTQLLMFLRMDCICSQTPVPVPQVLQVGLKTIECHMTWDWKFWNFESHILGIDSFGGCFLTLELPQKHSNPNKPIICLRPYDLLSRICFWCLGSRGIHCCKITI